MELLRKKGSKSYAHDSLLMIGSTNSEGKKCYLKLLQLPHKQAFLEVVRGSLVTQP